MGELNPDSELSAIEQVQQREALMLTLASIMMWL